MKPVSLSINEVQINGVASRESDAGARTTEKIAPNVINVISAKAIEMLPDLNVANVMQRISGISMMKNSSGNNTQVVVRGMPPRYTGTLINGVVIPSTSGTSRTVSLDIIPSVLVGRIEVTKGLTPDMDGSGIGGIVNVIMKDAPEKSFLNVDIATGYNQYLFNHDFSTFDHGVVNNQNPAQIHGSDYVTQPSDFPTANLVLNKIKAPPDLFASISYGNRFFNQKLGILISGTYQNTYQSSINTNIGTELFLVTNKIDTLSWNKYQYYNQLNRKAFVVKADFKINQNNHISLYNTYLNLNEIRTRHDDDTTSEINRGRVLVNDYTNLDLSEIESLLLQGKHIINDKLSIDWSMVYSVAASQSPDLVTVQYDQVIHPTIEPFYVNYTGAVTRLWQWNTDRDISGYINIKYNTNINNHLYQFSFGGMYQNNYKNNNENQYDFDQPNNPRNFPNPNIVAEFDSLTRQNATQAEGDEVTNPANFKAYENISAGYVMGKTNFGKLQVLAGVRAEYTDQYNTHNQVDKGYGPVASDQFDYLDVLPSVNLNYVLTSNQNIRLSGYKAINRPNYSEVVPYTEIGANGNVSGNANLKHTVGTCVDLRFEFYPKQEEVFTAGIYYKHLINPIEENTDINNNVTFTNVPQCTNYGFELVAIKYFGNFGINANYTYTYSIIGITKGYNVYNPTNPNDNQTIYKIENRPLVGQSPNIINIALIYRSIKSGFRCQLTYTMQDKNDVNPSQYPRLDSYQLLYNDMGFSIEKRLFKSLFLYGKCINMLNSNLKYQLQNGVNIENLTSTRSYLIGLKFNL